MTAVATDSLRKRLVELFQTDVATSVDSNVYYVGFGKADIYNDNDTVINPVQTIREERIARSNLQSVKKITGSSLVIPRYNWTSGTIYSAFTDSVVGVPVNTYYVLTEDNEVYVCLQQGKNSAGVSVPSVIKPSYSTAAVNQDQAFQTADGYRWKLMYSVSASAAAQFLSANFIPIEKVEWSSFGDSSSLNAFELQQLAVQKAAKAGQIVGAIVTNGGTGYTSAPSVVISGNGSNAQATATISGGSVVKIEMNNESAALGVDYDYASISFTGGGGSGAIARPVIGPVNGIGGDPRDDLKAKSVMLNVRTDGNEGGDFITDNDFRQVTIIRGIKDYSNNFVTSPTANVLRKIKMTTPASSFTIDNLIVGGTSNARAYINDIDSNTIFYHQNEKTGFIPFINSEVIGESDGSGSGTIDSAGGLGEANPFSGEVFYVENRARIIRSTTQQEDVKVIITV